MPTKEIIKVRGLVIHQTKGRSGLRFVCQFCNEFIEDAGLALLVWNPDKGEVLPAHKGCNVRDGDRFGCTMELGAMLMYLLWNSGIQNDTSLKMWQKNARFNAEA
jgi:hypothetical protein